MVTVHADVVICLSNDVAMKWYLTIFWNIEKNFTKFNVISKWGKTKFILIILFFILFFKAF